MPFLKRLASVLSSAFRALTPTCREVARLQSDALDRRLSSSKRIGLRVHLVLCKWCRRYGKQIRFLRRTTHEHPEELTEAAPSTLSAEARERLRRSLRDEAK
jgi:hypothetical protein